MMGQRYLHSMVGQWKHVRGMLEKKDGGGGSQDMYICIFEILGPFIHSLLVVNGCLTFTAWLCGGYLDAVTGW